MNFGKTKIILVLTAAIILTVIALFLIHNRYKIVIVDVPKFNHQQNAQPSQTQSSSSPSTLNPSPLTLLLPVPFTSQAPTANWDQLHNEACEEADAIMSAAYFLELPSPIHGEGSGERLTSSNQNLDPKLVESEIAKLTQWEDQNLGYHLDTTAAETAQMIESVYGLKTKLINNFSAEDIKNELAQNRLVIISEYGRALGNPYYKSPGPIHHMLLIKGYDGNNFITNDSGTKNGRNYIYTFDVIYNAAADWDHATNNVDLNRKIMIVVWK